MPYVVKDTKITSTGKSTRIQLDQHHPTQNYETWNVFYKHSPDAPAPQPGMTIECTPEANKDDWYWIDDWKPVQSNGGPQQAVASLPQDLQQRLNQAIAIESDVNPHPMGDAIKVLEGDGRTLSILLQTIIKGSSDPVQADAYLRWYIERLANPGIVFVDPK
jgi:hypothetical protein